MAEVREHHLHLSTEVEIRVTETAELVFWSLRDKRVLVAFGPVAAETIVNRILEVWPSALELMMVRSEGYRLKVQAKVTSGRSKKAVQKEE